MARQPSGAPLAWHLHRAASARYRGRLGTRANAPSPNSVPACGRRPVPRQARHAPALRANPYPEVTDLICRLPLPTLFYRLEAIHLGDQLRIWVRAGTVAPRSPLPDFQGPRGRSGHCGNCSALRVPNHISPLWASMDLERSCRKENSSRTSRRRLRVVLGCPDELSMRARIMAVPLPGCGIGTAFPFALGARHVFVKTTSSTTPLSLGLGRARTSRATAAGAGRRVLRLPKAIASQTDGGCGTPENTVASERAFPGVGDACSPKSAGTELRSSNDDGTGAHVGAPPVGSFIIYIASGVPNAEEDTNGFGELDERTARFVLPSFPRIPVSRRLRNPTGRDVLLAEKCTSPRRASKNRRRTTNISIDDSGRTLYLGFRPFGFLRFTPERFHVLLNSLFKVLFNFPSRYLFAIGLVVVFSLRWSLPPT
ncbi:hypothetical protein FQR65_LT09528 [Abscondita terminalis]|nr:hypothetical protein FQR65_LT09528 [Abscondita terminalis]